MKQLKNLVVICALGMPFAAGAQDRGAPAAEQSEHEQHVGPAAETPAAWKPGQAVLSSSAGICIPSGPAAWTFLSSAAVYQAGLDLLRKLASADAGAAKTAAAHAATNESSRS